MAIDVVHNNSFFYICWLYKNFSDMDNDKQNQPLKS